MNGFELYHRQKKVHRLVREIEKAWRELGVDGSLADATETMSERSWQLAASVAGVHEPSPETRRQVVQVLREREAVRA